jgi:HYR domain
VSSGKGGSSFADARHDRRLEPRQVTGTADPPLVPTGRKRRRRLALATAVLAIVPAIVTPGAGAVGAAVAEPPTFTGVTPVVVTKVNGVRDAVVDYDLPLAQDTAGLPLPVLCDPPPGSTFPLGDTTVNCTATDDQGVQAGASFVVRVLDDVAPPATTDVIVRGDTKSVDVTWLLPASSDIAGTEIVRFPGAFVVFRGRGTTFTDTDVRAGGSYRYRVASYDWAGNHAKAVEVHTTATRAKLVEPQDWAQLTRPPLLAWARVSGADYYNVQLWAIGGGAPRKVLSTWPTSTHLQLTPKWAFGGKTYGLAPGRYRWYVWPGLGAQKQGRYGNLIGSHVFSVVR